MGFVKHKENESVYQNERKRDRDCTGLVEELSDEDPTARRWAARDLINCPEAAAALVERLKIETDLSVQEVILSSLTRIGDQVALDGLVECLRSEDVTLRNQAVEAMKQLPDEVAPFMHLLLSDSNPDVRILAVNILESLRHQDVESWLINVIDNDQHINVCATAVDLLSEVGTTASLEPLRRLKMRFSDEPYIQFATDIALKRLSTC